MNHLQFRLPDVLSFGVSIILALVVDDVVVVVDDVFLVVLVVVDVVIPVVAVVLNVEGGLVGPVNVDKVV
jgi:hypothetical protein